MGNRECVRAYYFLTRSLIVCLMGFSASVENKASRVKDNRKTTCSTAALHGHTLSCLHYKHTHTEREKKTGRGVQTGTETYRQTRNDIQSGEVTDYYNRHAERKTGRHTIRQQTTTLQE